MRKKKLLTFLAIPLLAMSIFADSISLNTEILSVSNGPFQFGFGLAPTGTFFDYYASFKMHPKLQHNANFSLYIDFYTPHSGFGGYNYKTGTPIWYKKYHEIKNDPDYNLSGGYFNPGSDINMSLYQGFGTNPVAGRGHLINLGLDLASRYSMALEALDTHIDFHSPVFINPTTGEYNHPFGPGTQIPAYPWLQDSRNTLVNSIRFNFIVDLTVGRGFKVQDGLYLGAYFEYAPSWLGNNITMEFPTADYYQLSLSLSQYLTLYSKKQDNGRNWLSIDIYHTNNIQHTGGNVVPSHKIPYDNLENSFFDGIGIDFFGPQFIAGDCYSDISLGLYNHCYWGNIVNEASKTTYAVEWDSMLEMKFHLRLFGFMHFKYTAGYKFYSGIHTTHPGLYQNAKISFYISL